MRWIWVSIAALIVAQCAVAWSQEPSPSEGIPSQPEQSKPAEPQQPSASNQQSAPQPPIIVNVIPTPKTEEERAEEARDRKEKAELDRRLVDLTGELAWFTAGLFAATVALVLATGVLGFFSYVQSRDMKASIAVAKQSADAAKKAADAADLQAKTLFQAELPIVLVHNFRVAAREGEAINQLEIPEYPIFHFTIFNYGRTPAELVSYCVEQKVAKRLPETPEYEIERLITPGTVLGPHGGNIPFTHPLTVMGRERAVILNESEYLWLYGFVKFKDFMGTGETHETRFAAMGLLHSERPGQWFMFVYGSDTPAAYAERT